MRIFRPYRPLEYAYVHQLESISTYPRLLSIISFPDLAPFMGEGETTLQVQLPSEKQLKQTTTSPSNHRISDDNIS